MNEPKPLASLSSSLLARKGQAKPAMRPQGFGVNTAAAAEGAAAHDDLGWNDMGHDEPSAAPAQVVHLTHNAGLTPEPVPSVVRQQHAEIVREMAPVPATAPAPVAATAAPVARAPRAAPGSKGKAAFTLRLDPDRHLKLRLACAVRHKSAQMLVVEALDNFLANIPAVAELASTAKSSR